MRSKEDIKEYNKAYYQAHRDEILAHQKAYKKAQYQAHRNKILAYQKAHYQAHKAERNAYMTEYYATHRDEYYEYRKADTNSKGVAKSYIRDRSRKYLFNVLKHTKLEGYEIHHCFGYDDYKCFIYIPKALHLQIHQYLRDNNIDSDTDHYSKIAHLVVSWEGYVFIKD